MDFFLEERLSRIREYGDPVLRSRCVEVEEFGERSEGIARKLVDGLVREQNGIGLAANQIGMSVRAFSYDLRDATKENRKDFHGVIFNPEICDFAGGGFYNEGCLSIPGLYWDIFRPEEIRVVGFDVKGDPVDFDLGGLAARLFQHEVDHLDGLLLFDRIPDKGERNGAILQADTLIRSATRPTTRSASRSVNGLFP